ncbi:phytoene desaturase [Ktedonobacter racemifer]|uniref:Phytoene dehydrogenase n=1 Tax=Ktedonobacter racemifer DSM 44963 TaxID=485913 RepID=D6TI22_KTERA|nr:phytoene desaturase [Ktedonobacter racemifer]EFH89079.1 phytoene desaturase [Ktedonobacter racemifer DSM 44963]
MKIVVIGSGFGGLTAAIRLQAQGHEVTILEKRDKPGGRAYVYEQDGFTFDGGPTIITAPWLIHDLFTLCGKEMADYVNLMSIDPFYNIRFEDGSVFHYDGDREHILNEIRRFNPDDVDGYLRFAQDTEQIYERGFELIDQPFTTVSSMAKVAPDLVRLQAYKSVAGLVNQYIKDERLRQVFSFHPLLIGGNPFESTSIYALIHTLERKFGIWYAQGGTGALVKGLVKLFEDMGGTLHLNQDVGQIQVNERTGLTNGVVLNSGEYIAADSVVCNADVAYSYLNLVPAKARRKYTDSRIKKMQYSMSLFVIYFGTDRKYEDVAHHEILMGPRYKGLLDDIFKLKVLAKDFSLYLHRPTATDPSMAPEGCDCWYVLSPVPHLGSGIDWTQMAKPYRDSIVSYLEERYLPDLSKHIVSEHYIDPLHFQNTLNSHLGSAFSVEPILTQSAWFRPHNVSEDIANLYFAGAGTHPGAGLPGVMSSGKIVADMIGQDGQKGKVNLGEVSGGRENVLQART